jgi:4-amino-4-deoxy-L-arabinose transferase-like glycosyltransferase
MSTALAARLPLSLRQRLTRASLTSDTALLLYLALADVVAHLLIAGNYGYFRDELYYMIDGRHLAFGYVDQPPLIGWLAALVHVTLGDSLVALHILPALAAGAIVFVTGLIARELGGGRFAQLLAALATMVGLVFMATGSIFSMDVLDELLWALGAYVVVRLIRRDDPRLWLAFGLVVGTGLLNKLTILFFALAVVVGLLATPARSALRSRWIWLGAALGRARGLPFFLWNVTNGFPTVDFYLHYQGLGGDPLGFLANQILTANPFTMPLWIAGLYFYLRAPAGKPYRLLGWAYVFLYVLLTLIHAKPYFLAPAYPMLFAGGAIVFERAAQQARWRWVKPVYVPVLILSGLLLAPLAMPVLPPAAFVSHYGFLSGTGNAGAGQRGQAAFPQYLGDRFGWDTMSATVARVYTSLPPAERAQACVFTENYGEASALILYSPQYHLPPIISGHNNYYLWGPGSCTGQVIITVGLTQSDNLQSFNSVVLAATNTCDYCMPDENGAPIYICTQPKGSVQAIWPRVKHYD